jgi:hypothetical protein
MMVPTVSIVVVAGSAILGAVDLQFATTAAAASASAASTSAFAS